MESFGCMLAVRTPEASLGTCHTASRVSAFPVSGIRSATSITIDFGAILPFTVVPACNLPVYASQWPSPDITQDLVRGCELGFAAASISGDWTTRAFKAQPATPPYMRVRIRRFSSVELEHGQQPRKTERIEVGNRECGLQGRAAGQAPGPMGTAGGLCREVMPDVPLT